MKFPLTTGAYQAKSLIAEAQRCVNLYAEHNPPSASFPVTWYLTPGLTQLASVTPTQGNGWRQLYFASNGQLYGVCGSSVYAISSSWAATHLGDIGSQSGYVSMVDNANYLMIVDGSSSGWTVNLKNNQFAALVTAGFSGGGTVNFLDGFLILNTPGTRQWYVSQEDSLEFNLNLFAEKAAFSDNLVGIGVTRRYVYLFGAQTTEIWFNAGDSPFPFDEFPGVFMQYGCSSAASIAQMDGFLYWLAQSPQGNAIICKTNPYNADHISTFALDNEMASYPDLNQAIGYTYQLDGHFFYVITFPVSDVTWQFDLSTKQWSQLAWIDNDGVLHRHRANCYATAYGDGVVGDWQTGQLYKLDVNNYTDNGQPIARIRSFPHMVDDSSDRIHYEKFIANMEVGNGAGNVPVPVYLRWSDTRGASWGNYIDNSLGQEGEYLTSIIWRRLGMARDRVFEISWSAPVKTAIMGAWVEAKPNNQ